jgi:hypothetical protein
MVAAVPRPFQCDSLATDTTWQRQSQHNQRAYKTGSGPVMPMNEMTLGFLLQDKSGDSEGNWKCCHKRELNTGSHGIIVITLYQSVFPHCDKYLRETTQGKKDFFL